MSIQTVLANLESYVIADIRKAENSVAAWWKGFTPILETDFEKFVSVVGPIALALIKALAVAELNSLTGGVKLSLVSGALIAQAESQGITATKTMADTVVQQIVASISATKS